MDETVLINDVKSVHYTQRLRLTQLPPLELTGSDSSACFYIRL
jgi:hypothetical protein